MRYSESFFLADDDMHADPAENPYLRIINQRNLINAADNSSSDSDSDSSLSVVEESNFTENIVEATREIERVHQIGSFPPSNDIIEHSNADDIVLIENVNHDIEAGKFFKFQ